MRSIYFDGNTGTPDTARTLLYLHPLQELLTPDRGDPARRIPVMPGSVRQAATLPVARQKHFARPQPGGCVNLGHHGSPRPLRTEVVSAPQNAHVGGRSEPKTGVEAKTKCAEWQLEERECGVAAAVDDKTNPEQSLMSMRARNLRTRQFRRDVWKRTGKAMS